MELPSFARKAIELLENSGYECYAVGGCVRDSLLQKECQRQGKIFLNQKGLRLLQVYDAEFLR